MIDFTRASIERILKGTSLRALAIRGGLWLGAAYTIEQSFRLARNIILVRLLAPEAFGLMAIVTAVSLAFEAFTEIGIKEAVIQSPRGQQRLYLNSAWWLSFLRATALYLMAFLAAPWIAEFYGNPELTLLIRVVFLSLVLTGALSPSAYAAIKQMNFGRWVVINNLGGICGVLLAIVLAFAFRNVWALALGFVAEAAARLVLSFVLCPFRPELSFDRDAWRSLSKYALGMLGIPILTFIFMKADIFVVGKLRSHAELGLYSMAVTLAATPCLILTRLIREVAVPAFSKVQEDQQKINQALLKMTTIVAFAGIPGLFFVSLYGPELLTIVYGPQYVAVAAPFAIAFASALMSTSSAPIATVYLALGRPELHRLFTGVRAIVMLVLIYPAVNLFGLAGAATAGLISMAIGHVFQVLRIQQLTGLDPLQYFMILFRGSAISLCVVLTWLIKRHFVLVEPILGILPGALGCLIAWSVALAIYVRHKPAVGVHRF